MAKNGRVQVEEEEKVNMAELRRPPADTFKGAQQLERPMLKSNQSD